MSSPASTGDDMPASHSRDFAEFYIAYQPRLRRYLQRAFPYADHEGALQDTFARAYRHYGTVGALPDAWPWLATVAANVARNQVRGRRPRLVSLDAAAHVPDPAPLPDAQVLSLERLRAIGRAIDGLPAGQRDLVRLMISDGISATEAGGQLGLRPATARQQLHRLRGRLRRELARQLTDLAGLVPLSGVVAAAWRQVRRCARGPGAPGSVAASVLELATVLGVVCVTVTAAGSAPNPSAPRPPLLVVRPADGLPVLRPLPAATSDAQRGGTAGRPARRMRSATAARRGVRVLPEVPPHPLRTGQRSEADLWIDTDIGSIGVDDVGEQNGPASVCLVIRPLC